MEMTNSDFVLKVGGQSADVRALMCHFQQDPHPGGLSYQLTIIDRDLVAEAKRQFGLGTHRQIDSRKQSTFLSYLFPMIGLKCGRIQLRFWANTIDEVELSEDAFTLKGACSPHVST
jgi:hypothetical protein